jgi:hypothetical protein
MGLSGIYEPAMAGVCASFALHLPHGKRSGKDDRLIPFSQKPPWPWFQSPVRGLDASYTPCRHHHLS